MKFNGVFEENQKPLLNNDRNEADFIDETEEPIEEIPLP